SHASMVSARTGRLQALRRVTAQMHSGRSSVPAPEPGRRVHGSWLRTFPDQLGSGGLFSTRRIRANLRTGREAISARGRAAPVESPSRRLGSTRRTAPEVLVRRRLLLR